MVVKILLKEVRTSRGLSQNELARRLGQSLNNVQKIEYGGVKSVTLETLDGLCRVLECQPGDLLIHVPDPPQER